MMLTDCSNIEKLALIRIEIFSQIENSLNKNVQLLVSVQI